ncbi:uncharacterized protein PRCAT00000030001 [Priceomyces carsonii]|uniref:uncharacterized protein n=1 Tax=Priceomyces carsonii TaxID=28549 RepID=UPI002ED9EC8B|nr:unnamed protein product [Priceomyces carsonii]
MKAFTTITCFAVTALTTNAFRTPSIDGVKQFVFNEVEEDTILIGTDLLNSARPKSDNLKASEIGDILDAWKDLEKKHSHSYLESKIKQYNSKFSADKFNNKVLSKPEETGSKEKYQTLSNQKFDSYNLRIKKNNPEILGLDSVDQYTGYLDVDKLGKHFFFWFFESRGNPKEDPLILWLNGGPGCSSATGLFFELGPSLINSTLQPVFNPYSWNSNASVIFLDQPVGVGYSYTEGEDIKSTAAAAEDVYIFLELFFQKFPKLTNNKFHIAGESYAGHYIPSFASEIINRADRSFELSSVLIGNGITDPLIQYAYYKPMACGEGGYPAVIDEASCEKMEIDYPRCAALTKLCYSAPSAFSCVPATLYCEERLYGPYSKTGLNPYDIRKDCSDGGNCYVEMDYLDDYLNLDYVKDAVGASNIDIFTSCDDQVFRNFILSGDEMMPFQQYVAELLDKDIPVLLYAGDKDFICNWLGNHGWSDALEYGDHEQFEKTSLKPYITKNGKLAGEVKNYGIFSFVRIYDAGHMVPYDQPENSLDMVNRWINGDYSFGKK